MPGAGRADADSSGAWCDRRWRGACGRGRGRRSLCRRARGRWSRRWWARRRWSVGGCRQDHRGRRCRGHGRLTTASASNYKDRNGQASQLDQVTEPRHHSVPISTITIVRWYFRIIGSQEVGDHALRQLGLSRSSEVYLPGNLIKQMQGSCEFVRESKGVYRCLLYPRPEPEAAPVESASAYSENASDALCGDAMEPIV